MTVQELMQRLVHERPDARVFMQIQEPYDKDAETLKEEVIEVDTDERGHMVLK